MNIKIFLGNENGIVYDNGRENKELRWINLIYVNGVEKEVSDIITLHNMM